jgi:hypothetical protein
MSQLRLGMGVAFLAGTLLAAPTVRAVALYGTSSTTANTAAPAGALAGSGWQFQGTFGPSLGTAIAPSHFVTAKHFNVSGNQDFVYQGLTYDVIGSPADDPNSDLRIWQVSGTFPAFAPLYTSPDEVGKPLVVFGMGVQRSDTEVTVAGTPKGWEFAANTFARRWGTNDVTGIAQGGNGIGQALAFAFDAGAGANEAHLAGGDSGGGVFVQSGGVWKLAGVNYGIDGYKYSPTRAVSARPSMTPPGCSSPAPTTPTCRPPVRRRRMRRASRRISISSRPTRPARSCRNRRRLA